MNQIGHFKYKMSLGVYLLGGMCLWVSVQGVSDQGVSDQGVSDQGVSDQG